MTDTFIDIILNLYHHTNEILVKYKFQFSERLKN